MRFAFTEEQLELRQAVRQVLQRECTPDHVRAAYQPPAGGAPAADGHRWGVLRDLGVPGLLAPAAVGGLGLDEVDLVAVAEEAGRVALPEPIGSFTDAGFTKSVDVNVKGPVFLVQEALPHLRRSAHAAVVNVVSAGAWLFSSPVAHYAAAKSAMVSYTKSLASALAADGIRVNALAPGTVDTDMVRGTGPDAAERMARASLLGRAASPEEMVGPALFLASDASSFLTGTVVHADGGLVTR